MRNFIIIAIALLASSPAAAQKKAKPACDNSLIPMTPGATWVYQAVAPDEQKPIVGVQADAPEQITIKVVSIEAKGKSATITLEETFRKVSVQTTLSCSKSSFTVDPNSFYWAGEPGGGLHMKLTDVKRKGASYPGGKAFKRGASLSEEFRANVARTATENSRAKIVTGKVEMERELQIGDREPVGTSAGEVKAFRAEISLSGRGSLDGEKDSEREMAAGAKAVLWFAPGVGLIKAINRFNQAWVLKS